MELLSGDSARMDEVPIDLAHANDEPSPWVAMVEERINSDGLFITSDRGPIKLTPNQYKILLTSQTCALAML